VGRRTSRIARCGSSGDWAERCDRDRGSIDTSGRTASREAPTDEDLRVRIYNGDTAIITGERPLSPDGAFSQASVHQRVGQIGGAWGAATRRRP
jgi:hypothetical protein